MRFNVGKDLTRIKAAAKVSIDTRAGELRTLFFTAAPGQEAEYQIKLSEARDYLSIAAPGLLTQRQRDARFPLLISDTSVDGNAMAVQANIILAQYAIWAQALAAINMMRRSKKVLIDDETTVSGIGALVESMSLAEMLILAPELAQAMG